MVEFQYTEFIGRDIFGDKTYRQKRNLVVFAILGLFAKKLGIDLEQMDYYGVKVDPANAGLIPGFIGLAMLYTLTVLLISMYRDWFTYDRAYRKAFESAVEEHKVDHPAAEGKVLVKSAGTVRLYSDDRAIVRTNWIGVVVEFGISIAISLYSMWLLLPDSWESFKALLP